MGQAYKDRADKDRDGRAAYYFEKAREAMRLAEDAKSPEIQMACMALAANWNLLAKFQESDLAGALERSVRESCASLRRLD